VIVHFAETISGFVTIRAFGGQPRFAKVNTERVNANLRMDFYSNAANEWVGFRMEMIGTVVLASSALFMVTVGRNTIASGKMLWTSTMMIHSFMFSRDCV
jgi:ABC-type multidrug transport system fused ATPase/permease subunit